MSPLEERCGINYGPKLGKFHYILNNLLILLFNTKLVTGTYMYECINTTAKLLIPLSRTLCNK